MAEQVRSIDAILKEMFEGKDAAIAKYAKVRMVQYEMELWRVYSLPLAEVDGAAKVYFSKRFLVNGRIDKATEPDLSDAFEKLDHAVKDGCAGRCTRLVIELNKALDALGLDMVRNVDKFLDWLTFDYEAKKDNFGEVVTEKPYGFPLFDFHSDENRKEFWLETSALLKTGRMMSVQDIMRIVLHKRNKSVKLK